MKNLCNLRKELSHWVKYWIFRTRWGYFGVAGNENGLLRTLLPQANKENVKRQILKAFPAAKSEKKPFEQAIKCVLEYFDGKKVDFSDVPVAFDGLNPFAVKVLSACKSIKAGNTVNYKELAGKAGKPGAARAVGAVMAKNPLPLIIPCHRVIRSDGGMGGFSATGGINTKKKLIELERR